MRSYHPFCSGRREGPRRSDKEAAAGGEAADDEPDRLREGRRQQPSYGLHRRLLQSQGGELRDSASRQEEKQTHRRFAAIWSRRVFVVPSGVSPQDYGIAALCSLLLSP